MNDVNIVMDRIRRELKKGLPSKRKILVQLVNLLKKNKYPSLNDSGIYNIIGETYRLNVEYNLNLNMLFYPIYKELVKKIKKHYGSEKILEMGQYLSKNYGLFSPEHILNQIKQEFEQSMPKDLNSREHLGLKISTIFSNLYSKEEYQHLSDSDINFIIGETFSLDPELFMDFLNRDLRKEMSDKNWYDLDKGIIKKYVLLDDEKIIYESFGTIKFVDLHMVKTTGVLNEMSTSTASVLIHSGTIFITNYRLIVQGIIDMEVNWTPLRSIFGFESDLIGDGERKYQAKQAILESSPIYGYQFPIKNHINLKKKWKGVSYTYIQDNQFKEIEIKLPTETSQAQIDTIFQALTKDARHIKDAIKVLFEMELKNKWKSREIASLLLDLRVTEEYLHLTDSEYGDIVENTYRLNPQWFLTNVYPRIKTTNQPIKKDLIKIIENLHNETKGVSQEIN